jgi:hypothetical protein
MPEVADPDTLDRRGDGRPSPMTSSTDISNGSWAISGTTAIERATARRWSEPIGAPSSSTVPARGTRTPVSARRSVDFPAPFGPTRASRSPCATDSVAPTTIRRSP